MTHVTQGGTRILTRPTTNVPGGLAAPERTNFNQLMGRQRPAWADDPAVTLPCQRPDVDPDWWFEVGVGGENRANREKAIRLCSGCPRRVECKAQAKANGEPWGIWGGELREPLNGAGSAARRKRAGESL